jgi:thiamine biosynthesis lipoprotein
MMKRLRKFFCVLFAVWILLSTAGCKNGYSPDKVIDLFRFNTAIHIEVYDKAITNQTKNRISTFLSELEKEISLNSDGSTVKAFNDANINTPITFSVQAFELLSLAKDYTAFTDKKFNLAVYPLVKLWGFSSADYPLANWTIPSNTDVQTTRALCNPDDITLDQISRTAQKSTDGVKIDLGGIAKGYATDKILDILKDDGHTDGYISVGGSSMFVLSLKSKNNTLSIRHPEKSDKTVLSFKKDTVQNTAVSTSGDYERFYELDGKRYSHVINTETGAPTDTGIISTTVLGGSACFSDALTTALMLCEYSPNDTKKSELVKFIDQTLKTYPQLKIFAFYKKDGVKQLITNANDSDFLLNDQSFSVIRVK